MSGSASLEEKKGREFIVFYLLVENHDVGPELVYDDWAARVISPCLVVRPYRDDDIEWKRVRCGRAPSRLQLSGRSVAALVARSLGCRSDTRKRSGTICQ